MWVKNIDSVSNTYQGQLIAAGAFYEIQSHEENSWSKDSALLGDIGKDKAQMSDSGSDAGLISSYNDQIDALKSLREVIQKVQTHIGANKISLLEFGYNFTATKNSTTDNDLLLPVKYLRGAWVECESHAFGDEMDVQIVDVDDVLGAGAGYVADEFGKKVQIPKSGIFEVLSEAISNAIPAGLYFRCKFKSVGTVEDVKVRVNCRGYNDA